MIRRMSLPAIRLADFKPLEPRFQRSQDSALEWLVHAHVQAESNHPEFDRPLWEERMKKLVRRFSCGPDKIAKRGHELEDFTHQDWKRMRIFSLASGGGGLGAGARTAFFSEAVDRAFERLYTDSQDTLGQEPPHSLIHVTCTGYVSPSGAQKLVARRGWNISTTITHAYHMGCYAAIPAVRLASAATLARGLPSGRVDLVHTELCTIHLDPSLHSPEQLVIQSLFSDGIIRYSASMDGPGLELIGTREEIIPDTAAAMTWAAGDKGMEMSLSREVPALIGAELPGVLNRLFQDAGLDFGSQKDSCIFAVHPGGPKIIDHVGALLALGEEQIRHSRRVLREHGNMSSATLPFIWKEIHEDPHVRAGTHIVSMAFGPGLTLAMALLKKV